MIINNKKVLKSFEIYFALRASSVQLKTAKLVGGKTFLAHTFFVNFGGFSKRISPKIFGISGSNCQG